MLARHSLPTPVSTGSGSAGHGFSQVSTAQARSPGEAGTLGLTRQESKAVRPDAARYAAAMCNLYRMEKAPDAIVALARELGHEVGFPEGVPNFEPRDVRITERAPVMRRAGGLELVERRWSWPGPSGKPVFNYRGEGRRFDPAERCVVLADGFYEFTSHTDPKSKRKHKWLFTLKDQPWFAIAGLWRTHAEVGEAFTMLTCDPGPDVVPYHNRSIAIFAPAECARWLDTSIPACELLRPLPAGSTPATEWIFVATMASSSVMRGRIVASRLASMVFPDPGGPIIITL